MKNKYCEDCLFCELVDWELDEKKEHATPIYWCEKKHTYCEDVKKCKERSKAMTEKQALVLLIFFIIIWGGFALDLIIWKIKRSKAMRYIVKSVVRDYGVYQKIDDKEKLIEICNSKSNAELIADILNTDLKNTRYEVIKKSKVDKAKANIELMFEQEKQKDGTYTDVGKGIVIALGLINNEIGE